MGYLLPAKPSRIRRSKVANGPWKAVRAPKPTLVHFRPIWAWHGHRTSRHAPEDKMQELSLGIVVDASELCGSDR
jgi:hypothetical protein